jgi:hypothetical protein
MRKPTLMLLVIIAATLATACGSPSSPDRPEVAGEPSSRASDAEPEGNRDGKGKPKVAWTGPNFEVTTFEGETFELAAQSDRPVVLNFWESW